MKVFLAMFVIGNALASPSAMACKMTAIGGSVKVINAVTKFLLRNAPIGDSVRRIDVDLDEVRVKIESEDGTCRVEHYTVLIHPDCRTKVTEVKTVRADCGD